MRMVNLRKAKAELSAVIKAAQADAVCVTVHGKPVAVLTGVAGQDIEDILLSWDRKFWREVDKRTEGALARSVSLATAAKELGLDQGQKSEKKRRSRN
ncbi:MAG TPA: type II toxin-antitoxin system prevent-host-death family antitoxin [Polyangia bacterium]